MGPPQPRRVRALGFQPVVGVMEARRKALALLQQLNTEGFNPGDCLDILGIAIVHLHNLVPDDQQIEVRVFTEEMLHTLSLELSDGSYTVLPDGMCEEHAEEQRQAMLKRHQAMRDDLAKRSAEFRKRIAQLPILGANLREEDTTN